MTFTPESRYPSRRTYVLKVRSDATPDAMAGRLENIVTGHRLEFASVRELLEALARDLAPGGDGRLSDASPARGG